MQSIFRSMSTMVEAAAGAVVHTASMVSEAAETGEILARTGKNMALSNEGYMMKATEFKNEQKLSVLEQEIKAFAKASK